MVSTCDFTPLHTLFSCKLKAVKEKLGEKIKWTFSRTCNLMAPECQNTAPFTKQISQLLKAIIDFLFWNYIKFTLQQFVFLERHFLPFSLPSAECNRCGVSRVRNNIIASLISIFHWITDKWFMHSQALCTDNKMCLWNRFELSQFVVVLFYYSKVVIRQPISVWISKIR